LDDRDSRFEKAESRMTLCGAKGSVGRRDLGPWRMTGVDGMLGGMGRDLDSEMMRRLRESYGEMSDGELLGLAAKPEDLTDFAREVLRGEMTRRGIDLDGMAARDDPFSGAARGVVAKPEFGRKLPDGSVVLMTFHDAIAAGVACDWLEADGLEVDVRDAAARNARGRSLLDGLPVALEVIVPGKDRARAVVVLREKMGLFPLQEVEEPDAEVDDGTVSALGYFGRRGDAEEVARVLEEAGVWHRVTANSEGTVEDENAYSVEVREIDQAKAVEMVEKAMELPEE
jgi:hypothetical protein